LGAEYERVDLAILTEAAFNIIMKPENFFRLGRRICGKGTVFGWLFEWGWSDDEKKIVGKFILNSHSQLEPQLSL